MEVCIFDLASNVNNICQLWDEKDPDLHNGNTDQHPIDFARFLRAHHWPNQNISVGLALLHSMSSRSPIQIYRLPVRVAIPEHNARNANEPTQSTQKRRYWEEYEKNRHNRQHASSFLVTKDTWTEDLELVSLGYPYQNWSKVARAPVASEILN